MTAEIERLPAFLEWTQNAHPFFSDKFQLLIPWDVKIREKRNARMMETVYFEMCNNPDFW